MAKMGFSYGVGLLLVILMPLPGFAATIYIDDKVMVGLHQDKDVDSPIIKTLPSGTVLELLKRDTPLSQVKEPAGSSGWIDNRYLADAAPGRAQLAQLQEKAAKLETELSTLKANSQNASPPAGADAQKLAGLLKENEELNQQLKSERLKTGELQAQAAELRNQLSQAATQERSASGSDATTDAAAGASDIFGLSTDYPGWRALLTGIIICIVIGLLGGAFLMDWRNRQRHGGFRI